MKKYRLKIQNDILYLFLLLLVTEIFNYSVLKAEKGILVFIGFLGVLLLETWFIRIFTMYCGKKISQYSEVIAKISLKDRFFAYFVLPAIFYTSLLTFLFFNRNDVLGHTVLGVCMVLLLVLFLNVKSSLNKYYSLEVATRAIFDFICITIFFLLLNSFIRFGFSIVEYSVLSAISSFVLFLFVLKIHDRIGLTEIITSSISAICITILMSLFWDTNVFVMPAIGALLFYLIISLWNIRFAGKTKLSDYIVPFLYVAISIILIFTI
ncbi:MAG: hypothetical protein AB9915_00970 [Candidatus Dojkabacteria bacterium]